MNLFKIKITLLIVGFFSVLLFFYFAFIDTTWGGWTLPDASLKLNKKEMKWVKNFENKYQSTFEYIGLDNGYMEDSIIYITLNCHSRSILENNKIIYKEIFTKELCKKFLSNSDKSRTQKYIKFSYHNLKEKNKKNPISLNFIYFKNLDRIVKLE
jgi:hypothetical protein